MRIAVVVPTYNRPDALAAVLASYAAQTDLDFELIVADDGSTADTGELVREFAAQAPFATRHVWHDDLGFRLAAVRNRAVASTSADYIIFTDGDCIASRAFVDRHRRLAQRSWFLSGSRVLLSEGFTRRVLEDHLAVHDWTWREWIRARQRGDINRVSPLLYLPDGWFRRLRPNQWEGLKTCNLSLWRDDLARVNGVNESYTGWGLEDSDLVIRLLRAGVKHKSARFAAPVFHLWHAESERGHLQENRRRLDEVLQSDRIRAREGLDRYLHQAA